MTSKSEAASSQAVKTRKNLAPGSNQKARVNARNSSQMQMNEVPLKVATNSVSENEPASTGSRQRNNLLRSGANNHGKKKAPVNRKVSIPKTGVRNLRAPLLGELGSADKESLETSKKKTQAEMAREKLATAAAKTLHANSQAQAKARSEQLQAQKAAAAKKPSTNKQRRGAGERQAAHDSPVKPGNQLIHLKQKFKGRAKDKDTHQSKKPPIINATALLAAKYPNYFADSNDHRTKAESRTVMVISTLILGLIGFSWINWNTINFQHEGDFTYNSGLIGGISMLLVLLYAVRKRMKIMRKAGNMEAWYYFHLLGGVLGPLIIVFHTGFTIKSINSGVALFTMITIVLSGLFGRYIYTRIGYSLHKKLLAIKESESQLMESLHSYESPLGEKIERRLSNFSLSVLTGDRSILKLPMRVVAIRGAATACYVKVSGDLSTMIKTRAKQEGWAVADVKARINREKEQLRDHIGSIANIANSHLFERILVRWRILHIPLLYILTITALFHVLAVHMY